MIKLTSFYPFENFLRVTQEFYDDKAIVKTKSLRFERGYEFNYKDVGEISDAFLGSNRQSDFSFWLLAYTSFALTVFHKEIYNYLFLLRTAQALYICALFLFATSFIRSWHIEFSDKDDNYLTRIKQTRFNRHQIAQVMEIVKNKSKDIQEITVTNPFPKEQPRFEHIAYDDLGTTKTIERFYENELLGLVKSISGEHAYRINYKQLSGKVYRGKMGNDAWTSLLTIFTFAISVIGGFVFGFRIYPSLFFAYIIVALAVILAISSILYFVKQEAIGLYDTKGNVEYWTWVNKLNKENIEEIIKFIQSKIPAENKA